MDVKNFLLWTCLIPLKPHTFTKFVNIIKVLRRIAHLSTGLINGVKQVLNILQKALDFIEENTQFLKKHRFFAGPV